jgi:hypothetical protein
MQLSSSYVSSRVNAMRGILTGTTVVIRHDTWEYSGTRQPHQQGEVVDESGAMFTVTGGLRLITIELGPVWPKAGDLMQTQVGTSQVWQTYVIISARLEESQASILLTYGERYDEEDV